MTFLGDFMGDFLGDLLGDLLGDEHAASDNIDPGDPTNIEFLFAFE